MAEQDNKLTPPLENSSLENYTGTELPYKMLYLSGIALAVTSVVFAVALVPMRDAMIAAADKRNAGEVIPAQERPTKSVLQQDPESVWQVHENLMAEAVSTFGWSDKARGLVRVPVDRAVEMILAEGSISSTPDAQPAVLYGGGHSAADDHGSDALAAEPHGPSGSHADADDHGEAAH